MIKMLDKISRKHYIQCVLSVLLTGVFLYFTSFLWLSKGIFVSFYVQADRDIEYRVYYTENVKDKFISEQSSVKKIKTGARKVIIKIPTEKLKKIRIDFGSNPGKIVLSEFVIEGSEKVKLNGKMFKQHQIDEYAAENEIITVMSKQKDPYLVYEEEIDLMPGTQINPYRLIIISILLFLLMYKFVQYLSKFKLEKQYSRIDIVMLAVFFALLFVPMSRISDAQKSEQEKRMLAPKPQFTLRDANSYGTQFDAWYNDHFFGRSEMMKLYNNHIKPSMSRFMQNEKSIKSEDDMIFSKSKLERLATPLPEDVKKKISENIAELQKFAARNDIDLYILIPPWKEDVYRSKLDKIFPHVDKNYSIIYDLQEYIKEKNHIDMIYPREVFMKKYNDLTHSPVDHHWTEFGAFLGYGELIDVIKKKYPEIKKLKESDFNTFYYEQPRLGGFRGFFDRHFYTGSDCAALGLDSNCPLFPHKYYDHKKLKNLKVERGLQPMSRITHYDDGIAKNVTLLGNSYGGFLMEFLPYNFKNVQMLRVNNNEKGIKNDYDMKRFEKLILDFKTDILIFFVASSYVYEFQNLY